MRIKLYDYPRSSAAYRVRIALALKSVAYEKVLVNILPEVSAQKQADYQAINPQMRVPSLVVEGMEAEGNGAMMDGASGQSLALIEWINETWPEPPLLPSQPWLRLKVRAFAQTIACDIHPLNNLSVLAVLRERHGADEAAIKTWYGDWILRGFAALETLASEAEGLKSAFGHVRPGGFLFSDTPSLADICLVPQMANARRYDLDLSAFPRLLAADAHARAHVAFIEAAP